MRVLNRKAFLMLPIGTAFCKGKEWFFEGLAFKDETIVAGEHGDWYEADPAWVDGEDSGECIDRLIEMLATGASYPMQNSICRDGLFEPDDVFLIFEREDLLKLRTRIDAALAVPQ